MNLTRINHLLRAYFIENKKTLLICCLIVFAAAVLNFTLIAAPLSVMIACFIPCWIAGRFFQPSLKRNNSTHFFNLPVTASEKLIVATVVIISFTAVILLLHSAGAYTGYHGLLPILNPEGKSIVESNLSLICFWHIRAYLDIAIVIFVFLFGSIYFKKNAFLKTLVSGIGFFTTIALYQLGLLYFAFGKLSNIPANHPTNINILNSSFIDGYYITPIAAILFFLSLTYLRLKETEV
jgi:hypothetical protein